jgi:hypothetical protein
MGAFGSFIAVIFGIGWTVLAYYLTRDSPVPMVGILFPLFGVLFVVVGIVQAYYHFTNATGQKRFSAFDITDDDEERDPLNQVFGRGRSERLKRARRRKVEGEFCPFCGAAAQHDFDYCPKCGKEI